MNIRTLFISFIIIISLLTLQGCGSSSSGGGGGGGSPGSPPVQMGGSLQGNTLSLSGAVSTIAGTALSADGSGSAANFAPSAHITTDGTNLYVAGITSHTIRQIVIATGVVSTLAGQAGQPGSADGTGSTARFSFPTGITTDGINLYVSSLWSYTIRQVVIATGAVTTIAGNGTSGTTDGIGTLAQFGSVGGITIATDKTSLYISDSSNHTIRQMVLSSRVVTTIAGTVGISGSADGIGTVASFNYPYGITTDGTNLYVADRKNHTIRRIVLSTGMVNTGGLAGSSGIADGDAGTVARFNTPIGVYTDGTNVYVTNNSHTIRQVDLSTNMVTTPAGTAYTSGSDDGTGNAARFRYPTGITGVGTNLYIVDGGNLTIRQLAIAGANVTTLASIAAGTDGVAADARFYSPRNLTSDGTYVYLVDNVNKVVRQIEIATNNVVTIAGGLNSAGSADGNGTSARFSSPQGITTDGTNLYLSDSGANTIRQMVLATGDVTTIAGTAFMSGIVDGMGAAARFNVPSGITTDGINLYIADTNNHTIRQMVLATGDVTTLAGSATTSGFADGAGAAALFNYPGGITTDGTYLFVADTSNNRIRRIVIATGVVTTLAGDGISSELDGIGTAARFNNPGQITSDGVNLYVVDEFGNTVRKIVITTGVVSTVAGMANTVGSADGVGAAASFNYPRGITTDGNRLFITDTSNATVRAIQ